MVLAPPSGNPPTTPCCPARSSGRAGGSAPVAVDLDRVALADLGALWPEGVGGNARAWLTENVSAGTCMTAHVAFTLAGTENGDDLDLTEAGGTLTGDDVTVWWLRPVPPIQHGRVAVTWQSPDVVADRRRGRAGRACRSRPARCASPGWPATTRWRSSTPISPARSATC